MDTGTQKIVLTDEQARQLLTELREKRLKEKEVEIVTQFQENLQDEYKRAIDQHGHFHSLHEAYGVILEEVDEFWDEVKKRRGERNLENLKKELIQIAAMCQKLTVDIECNFGRF